MLAVDRDGVPTAYGARCAGELWVEVPGVATFHLPPGGSVLTAIPDQSVDSDAVLDAYSGTVLPVVAQATLGFEVLHGSAVRVPLRNAVVAFCGVSESGKSTVAHALTVRGYDQWADDALAFGVDESESVTAVGLPFTSKLRHGSLAYFGTSLGDGRVITDFEWRPARLIGVFLLEPIDVPERGHLLTTVRLPPSDALHALLPNAYRFRPQTEESRRQTMQSYLELVATVPVFAARFWRGFDRLPELVDELERQIVALE